MKFVPSRVRVWLAHLPLWRRALVLSDLGFISVCVVVLTNWPSTRALLVLSALYLLAFGFGASVQAIASEIAALREIHETNARAIASLSGAIESLLQVQRLRTQAELVRVALSQPGGCA